MDHYETWGKVHKSLDRACGDDQTIDPRLFLHECTSSLYLRTRVIVTSSSKLDNKPQSPRHMSHRSDGIVLHRSRPFVHRVSEYCCHAFLAVCYEDSTLLYVLNWKGTRSSKPHFQRSRFKPRNVPLQNNVRRKSGGVSLEANEKPCIQNPRNRPNKTGLILSILRHMRPENETKYV